MKRWFRDASFRGLLKNSGFLLSSRIVAGLLALGALSFTTHALGTELFGILILVHSYAGAMSGLVKFQSWQLVIRFGSPALQADDVAQLQRSISFAIGLDITSGIVGMVAAIALLPLVGGWFRIGPEHLMLAMLYCTLLPTMAAATPTGVLRLLDRFDLLSWQAAITPGVRLILAGAAWAAGGHFEVFLLIWYLTDMLGDLALWAMAFRELSKRNLLKGLRFGLRRHARHMAGAWRFALMTNLTTSLQAAWGPMANLLVGGLLGPVGAGQYRIAATVIEAANKPADMLSKAFYPEVMRMDFKSKRPWKLMLRGAVLSGLLGIFIVLIVLVGGKPFISAAFGKAFAPAGGLLALMVFGMLLTMIGFPLGPMSYAVDRPDGPLRARMIATFVYLILIFPFTRLCGLTGAGLAFVLSMLILNLLMLPPLLTAYRRNRPQPTHAA